MPPVLLIMGLPGSGKTTLADACASRLRGAGLSVTQIIDEAVHRKHQDWDFSSEGHIRQAVRLLAAANASRADFVIMDFVAGLPEQRAIIAPNALLWMNTASASPCQDSDAAFVPPERTDLVLTTHLPDNINRAAMLALSILRPLYA